MDDAVTVFVNVNDRGILVGMLGESAGDSVEGRVCESYANDVVQGLF